MSKIYVLQKDTPVSKIGDEFEYSEKADCYRPNGEMFIAFCPDKIYRKETVENNPEWFLPKEEEKIVIRHFDKHEFRHKNDMYYEFQSSKEIPPEKFPAIITAVEWIVNHK